MSNLEYKKNGVFYKFFEKNGGTSTGIYSTLNLGLGSCDERENILKNREIVNNYMKTKKLLTLSQCHGNNVVIVDKIWDVENCPMADAMVTNLKNVSIGILTADCGPVLFYDDVNNIIGACHSGWRGTKQNIVKNTIGAMVKLGGDIKNIHAVLGPCLDQKNFEVGDEFYQNFVIENAENKIFFKKQNGRYYFDMKLYIKNSILLTGVKHFKDLGIDTYDNCEKYFSYRRCTHQNLPDYGRQISVICLY